MLLKMIIIIPIASYQLYIYDPLTNPNLANIVEQELREPIYQISGWYIGYVL